MSSLSPYPLPALGPPTMSLDEKNIEKVETQSSDEEEGELDLTLHDPKAEDTLHRGLKARQISMIAVSTYPSWAHPCTDSWVARWCSWNRSYHRFGHCPSTRWSPWSIARLLLRRFCLLPRHGISWRDGGLPTPQERIRRLRDPLC